MVQRTFFFRFPYGVFALLLCLALSLNLSPYQGSLAAGTTFLTHGRSGEDLQAWLPQMQQAIIDRIQETGGETEVSTGIVTVRQQDFPSSTTFTWIDNQRSTADSGEILVIIDWSDVGDFELRGTNDVADAVTSVLPTDILEVPIQMIAHSRGASLICRISKRLGEQGIWVDQITSLAAC